MSDPRRRVAQWLFVVAIILGSTIGLVTGMVVIDVVEGGPAQVRELWAGRGVTESESKGGMIGALFGLGYVYRYWRSWALSTGRLSQEEVARIIPF
mgnify:FL=1